MFSSVFLKNKFLVLFTILLGLFSFTSQSAKAEQGKRYEINGISLKANKAFGLNHGEIVASQYKTEANDLEQLFEEIPAPNNSVLIKNIKLQKFLNSYRTIIGSVPNY